MINEKIILKLTNPTSFERGFKYYQKGRVTAYKNENNIISATVIGTGYYESLIDLSNLKAECDCPAYSNNLLCKHLVALLFTYMSGEIKSKSLPKVKGKIKQPEGDKDKDLSQIIDKFSKEEIVYHLKRIDADYGIITDYLSRLLLSEKSIDYSMMRKTIRSRVNYFSKGGYINNYFRKMMEAQYDILSLTDSLPNSKSSSEFLLETAYWINEKLDVIDDSDGISIRHSVDQFPIRIPGVWVPPRPGKFSQRRHMEQTADASDAASLGRRVMRPSVAVFRGLPVIRRWWSG